MCVKLRIGTALLVLATAAWAADEKAGKKHPVYLSFLIHCEASPIRGVAVDVQTEPYSGEGILPRNQYLDKILDVCERNGIKFEFAITPVYAQQLRVDRPDIIERIKRMKLPVTRYPSIAGHVLPAPVGELRDMPGMLLTQLRNREVSWEEYIRNEWIAETRTLIPTWRLEGKRVIIDNPRAGTPMKLDELSDYRIPEEDRRLYGGTLALEEIFGVIPLPVFPPIYEGAGPSRFRPTPVRQALGMGSYEVSRYPFQAFNAPIRATDPKMVEWFVKHFPVDKPLHADAGFGYTYGYQGNYVGLNVNEKIIEYAVNHPDEYKIVWPDPEETQWAPENSPLEFFKRSYGVSSLKEVRDMPPPVRSILENDPSVPIRQLTREQAAERKGWKGELLYPLSEIGVTSDQNLPDFLRPKEKWVTRRQVRAAATSVVKDTRFTNGLGVLPRQVQAGNETWSLATSFVALANALEQFGLYDRMPEGFRFPEVMGPVDYPAGRIETPAALDEQVGRLRGVPQNPYLNEVNLLHAVWEVAEQVRADQKIPARVQVQISENERGNYSGSSSQANAAEFLYAMAQLMVRMEVDGLPDEVPFRRVVIAPEAEFTDTATPAWSIEMMWTRTDSPKAEARTVARAEILEAAEYLMTAWTLGHLGHQEDIGGPPYGARLSENRTWSLNDAFQALILSLDAYRKTGSLPEQVRLAKVLGPVTYPMYELRSEPAYNVRMLRGGWQPYQLDLRDFPPEDWITPQGLPGFNHGSYQAFVSAGNVLASVEEAAGKMRETGIIPGSVRIELPRARRSPRTTDPNNYLNAAELLWAAAQLYRYIEVLGSADDVFLRSCRLIKDQLHLNVVGLDPIGFSRQTYRYRRDQFDWIEKVPIWRIHKTWAYAN